MKVVSCEDAGISRYHKKVPGAVQSAIRFKAPEPYKPCGDPTIHAEVAEETVSVSVQEVEESKYACDFGGLRAGGK